MPEPRRPWIAANFAMTVDGKISTRAYTPSLFTSPADKARLQDIRATADAILAGRGTVAADTMSMGLSRPDLRAAREKAGKPPAPLRVIVSNSGRLEPEWKVFRSGGAPLVVFSTAAMPLRYRAALAPLCELHLFESRVVPLPAALRILREDYGVRRIVCEGGGRLFRSLADAGAIDEIFLTIAPKLFGGFDAPGLTGLPSTFLSEPLAFRIASWKRHGDEVFLHLLRKGSVRRSPTTPAASTKDRPRRKAAAPPK